MISLKSLQMLSSFHVKRIHVGIAEVSYFHFLRLHFGEMLHEVR